MFDSLIIYVLITFVYLIKAHSFDLTTTCSDSRSNIIYNTPVRESKTTLISISLDNQD